MVVYGADGTIGPVAKGIRRTPWERLKPKQQAAVLELGRRRAAGRPPLVIGAYRGLHLKTARALHREGVIVSPQIGDRADLTHKGLTLASQQLSPHRRASNPAFSRFAYVAQRFPYAVFVRTVMAWLYAVGRDREVKKVHELTTYPDRMVLCRNKGICSQDGHARNLLATLETWIAQGVVPAHSDYDRYLPWVAKLTNTALAPMIRDGEFVMHPLPAGYVWGLDAAHPDLARPFGLPYPHGSPGALDDYRHSMHVYLRTLGVLQDGLRLIVAYAQAKGIDLMAEVKKPYELGLTLEDAERWKKTKAVEDLTPVAGSIQHIFPDRWTIQHLDSPDALEYEGEAMSHCVADYIDPFDENVTAFSLRDPDGRPHVTIEIDHDAGAWRQVKGFANSAPKLGYLRRVACWRLAHPVASGDFLVDKGFDANFVAEVRRLHLDEHFEDAWLDRRTLETWVLLSETRPTGTVIPYLYSSGDPKMPVTDGPILAWTLWRLGYQPRVGGSYLTRHPRSDARRRLELFSAFADEDADEMVTELVVRHDVRSPRELGC